MDAIQTLQMAMMVHSIIIKFIHLGLELLLIQLICQAFDRGTTTTIYQVVDMTQAGSYLYLPRDSVNMCLQ